MRGFLIGEYSDQGLHCQLSLSGAIHDKDRGRNLQIAWIPHLRPAVNSGLQILRSGRDGEKCPTRRHAWKGRHPRLTGCEKALNKSSVPT